MKTSVRIYITTLLKLLSERIPSDKHSLTLGSDGRLWLWILIGEDFQSIIFDEEFCNETAEQVVEGIIKLLQETGYNI